MNKNLSVSKSWTLRIIFCFQIDIEAFINFPRSKFGWIWLGGILKTPDRLPDLWMTEVGCSTIRKIK